MFNFSANHLFLLSRTEYRKCAVFLLRDLDTQRVYRLHDFTKALLLRPGVAYSVAGKVNSVDKLYLVLESVRLDTKHSRPSKLMLLLTVREGRLSANHLGLSVLEVPRRGPVFPRPAPPHSCASHSRRAAIPTTKPAILRVFYIGTNNPVMPKSLADHSPC